MNSKTSHQRLTRFLSLSTRVTATSWSGCCKGVRRLTTMWLFRRPKRCLPTKFILSMALPKCTTCSAMGAYRFTTTSKLLTKRRTSCRASTAFFEACLILCFLSTTRLKAKLKTINLTKSIMELLHTQSLKLLKSTTFYDQCKSSALNKQL